MTDSQQKYRLREKHFDLDKLADPVIYGNINAIKTDIVEWLEDFEIPLHALDKGIYDGIYDVYLIFNTVEDKMCFMHRWC